MSTMSTTGRVREQTAGWAREQIAYIFGMYAYAYGFPLVMMDVTRQVMTAAPRSGEYSAPVGQFHRLRDFVDPDFKNVVRISRNSLWATAFLDLAAEPAVFSHPAPQERYLADGLVSLASLADGRWRRSMTKRGFARLPGRGRTELAERLPASQGTFAGDVLRATAPLLPGRGGAGASKSGGQTRQASPSRRAGPCHLRQARCPRRADRGSPQACLPS